MPMGKRISEHRLQPRGGVNQLRHPAEGSHPTHSLIVRGPVMADIRHDQADLTVLPTNAATGERGTHISTATWMSTTLASQSPRLRLHRSNARTRGIDKIRSVNSGKGKQKPDADSWISESGIEDEEDTDVGGSSTGGRGSESRITRGAPDRRPRSQEPIEVSITIQDHSPLSDSTNKMAQNNRKEAITVGTSSKATERNKTSTSTSASGNPEYAKARSDPKLGRNRTPLSQESCLRLDHPEYETRLDPSTPADDGSEHTAPAPLSSTRSVPKTAGVKWRLGPVTTSRANITRPRHT